MAIRRSNPNYGAGRTQALVSNLGMELSNFMNTRAARDQQARIFDINERKAQQALEIQNFAFAQQQEQAARLQQKQRVQDALRLQQRDAASGLMDVLGNVPTSNELTATIPGQFVGDAAQPAIPSIFDPNAPMQDPTLNIPTMPLEMTAQPSTAVQPALGQGAESLSDQEISDFMMALDASGQVPVVPATDTRSIQPTSMQAPASMPPESFFATGQAMEPVLPTEPMRFDQTMTASTPFAQDQIRDIVANEEAQFIQNAINETGATPAEARAAFQGTLDSIIEATGDTRLRQFSTAGRAAATERATATFETNEEIRKHEAEQANVAMRERGNMAHKAHWDILTKRQEQLGKTLDPLIGEDKELFDEMILDRLKFTPEDEVTQNAILSMADQMYMGRVPLSQIVNELGSIHLSGQKSNIKFWAKPSAVLRSQEIILKSLDAGDKVPDGKGGLLMVREANANDPKEKVSDGKIFHRYKPPAFSKDKQDEPSEEKKEQSTEDLVNAITSVDTDSLTPQTQYDPNKKPSVNKENIANAESIAADNLNKFIADTKSSIKSAKSEKDPDDTEYFMNKILNDTVDVIFNAKFDGEERLDILKELGLLESYNARLKQVEARRTSSSYNYGF